MRAMLWATVVLGALACVPEGDGGGDPVDGFRPTTDGGAPADAAAIQDARPADGAAPRDLGADHDAAVRRDAAPGEDAAAPPDADALAYDAFTSDAGPAADAAPAEDAAVRPDAAPPVECPAGDDPHPDLEPRVEGRFGVVDAFPSAHVQPRRVTLYLPADYAARPAERWPVLYVHDGQNQFDPARAAFGNVWHLDRALDAEVAAGAVPPMIVVAVDNVAARLDEYGPSVDPEYMAGGGAADYGRFLVEELKPWVDHHLRTRCGRLDTGVMGSSMGGLVSYFLLREHPAVFGRVGVVSPSFWWNGREVLHWTEAVTDGWRPGTRLWIDGGNAEGRDQDGDGRSSVLADTRAVVEALSGAGVPFGELLYHEDVPGQHDEPTWAARLPMILRALWGDPLDGPPDALTIRPFGALAPGARIAVSVDATWPGPLTVALPAAEAALASDAPEVAGVIGTVVEVRAEGNATLRARFRGVEASLPVGVAPPVALDFVVTVPPWTPPEDTIYLRGDVAALGAWEGDPFPLARGDDDRWRGTIEVPTGATVAFKVTRGGWETVEKGAFGEEIANRAVVAAPDLQVEVEVQNWADLPR